MSVIWANDRAIDAATEQEHYDYLREFHNAAMVDTPEGIRRAPRAASETLVDWVCRFTDVRLDTARMEEIAVRELGATAERVA